MYTKGENHEKEREKKTHIAKKKLRAIINLNYTYLTFRHNLKI